MSAPATASSETALGELNRLLEARQVLELVGIRQVQDRGGLLLAQCPLHMIPDPAPSLSVFPGRNTVWCDNPYCGAHLGGTLVDLYAAALGLGVQRAGTELAQMAAVPFDGNPEADRPPVLAYRFVEMARETEDGMLQRGSVRPMVELPAFLAQHPAGAYVSVYRYAAGSWTEVSRRAAEDRLAVAGDLIVRFGSREADHPAGPASQDEVDRILTEVWDFTLGACRVLGCATNATYHYFDGRTFEVHIDRRVFGAEPSEHLAAAFAYVRSRLLGASAAYSPVPTDDLVPIESSIVNASQRYKVGLEAVQLQAVDAAKLLELVTEAQPPLQKLRVVDATAAARELYARAVEAGIRAPVSETRASVASASEDRPIVVEGPVPVAFDDDPVQDRTPADPFSAGGDRPAALEVHPDLVDLDIFAPAPSPADAPAPSDAAAPPDAAAPAAESEFIAAEPSPDALLIDVPIAEPAPPQTQAIPIAAAAPPEPEAFSIPSLADLAAHAPPEAPLEAPPEALEAASAPPAEAAEIPGAPVAPAPEGDTALSSDVPLHVAEVATPEQTPSPDEAQGGLPPLPVPADLLAPPSAPETLGFADLVGALTVPEPPPPPAPEALVSEPERESEPAEAPVATEAPPTPVASSASVRFREVARRKDDGSFERGTYVADDDLGRAAEEITDDGWVSAFSFSVRSEARAKRAALEGRLDLLGDFALVFEAPDEDPIAALAAILPAAWEVIARLVKEVKVARGALYLFFNGRGIEIHVDHRVFGIEPRPDLHRIYDRMRVRLSTPEASPGPSYSPVTLLRLEGTRDPKTDRFKIGLTYEQLQVWAPEEIREYATSAHPPLMRAETCATVPSAEVFLHAALGAAGSDGALEAAYPDQPSTPDDDDAHGHATVEDAMGIPDAYATTAPRPAPPPPAPAPSAWAASLDQTLSQLSGQSVERLALPWPAITRLTGGGLATRQLVAVSAPRGAGATSFSLQLADHVASTGRHALVLVSRLQPADVLAKSVARLGRLDAQAIRSRAWESARKDASRLKSLFDYGTTQYRRIAPYLDVQPLVRATGLEAIESLVRSATATHGKPPLVVIDDWRPLYEDPAKGEDEQLAQARRAVQSLAALAVSSGAVLWVVAPESPGDPVHGAAAERLKDTAASVFRLASGTDLVGLSGIDERRATVHERTRLEQLNHFKYLPRSEDESGYDACFARLIAVRQDMGPTGEVFLLFRRACGEFVEISELG